MEIQKLPFLNEVTHFSLVDAMKLMEATLSFWALEGTCACRIHSEYISLGQALQNSCFVELLEFIYCHMLRNIIVLFLAITIEVPF